MKEMVDKFCTVGVKRFMNPYDCKCEEFRLKESGCEFNLKVIGNPLLNYVEVPSNLKSDNLQYQAILKGIIRGAFEVLKFKATITIIYETIKMEKNECIFFVELIKDIQKE